MLGTVNVNGGGVTVAVGEGTQFFHLQDGCACLSGPRGLQAPDVGRLKKGRSPARGRASWGRREGEGGWDRVLAPSRLPAHLGSGSGCCLACFLFLGSTWAGGFTCLRQVAGSCANACYLSPRWAGPGQRSAV